MHTSVNQIGSLNEAICMLKLDENSSLLCAVAGSNQEPNKRNKVPTA
jgi:hypothetical protein